MPKKTALPAEPHPLVGRWFHTFVEEDGKRRVQYQGCVLATAENGLLVQFYEWFFGDPTDQGWFPWSAVTIPAGVAAPTWVFYSSAKEMNEAYYEKYQPRPESSLVGAGDPDGTQKGGPKVQ